MEFEKNSLTSTSETRCEVCGEAAAIPLGNARLSNPETPITCRSFVCQQIANRKAKQNPFHYKNRVEAQRKIVKAQRELMESEIQRIELLRDKLTAQNEKVLENATRHLPQVTPQIRIVNIPTGRSNISPLSVERIEEYKNFLKQIISEASKLSQDFEVTDSGERKAQKDLLKSETLFERNKNLHIVSDELCGICKGGCCANGQEHAYITASTIRRFMNENPSLDAAEVLDSYVGKLEKETAEESCINQTKTGCGLPREMRSDSCNAYFCQELRNLHDEVNKQPITETGLLAVQRPYIHWDRESEDACTDVTSAHFVSTEDVIPVEISDIEN